MGKLSISNTLIRDKFINLCEDQDLKPQQRGYEFEKLIEARLKNESLEPRASYKPKAEQIDGSFFWEGRTFLLEAKWVKDKVSASTIYAFRGKVEGKFHTTSGIFLAVNGYHNDVEEGLKAGKALNILLFDKSDIQLIFNDDVTFLEVLKFKLRHAGDTGSLNVPYKIKNESETITKSDLKYINFSKIDDDNINSDLLIFVEGQADRKSINILLESLKSNISLSYRIVVLEGINRILDLPALISQYTENNQTKAVLVFLDENLRTAKLEDDIKNTLDKLENSSIPVNTKFLFIDDQLKRNLLCSTNKLSKKNFKVLQMSELYEDLNTFIINVHEEYYDPEIHIPFENLKATINEAKWNFKKSEIKFPDHNDYTGMGTDITIENIEDLVQYLNDEVISAMEGSMPLYWIKEQDYLDYDTEVREYLLEHYKKKIIRLKWDITAL